MTINCGYPNVPSKVKRPYGTRWLLHLLNSSEFLGLDGSVVGLIDYSFCGSSVHLCVLS